MSHRRSSFLDPTRLRVWTHRRATSLLVLTAARVNRAAPGGGQRSFASPEISRLGLSPVELPLRPNLDPSAAAPCGRARHGTTRGDP